MSPYVMLGEALQEFRITTPLDVDGGDQDEGFGPPLGCNITGRISSGPVAGRAVDFLPGHTSPAGNRTTGMTAV
jgi:hypothetical protein